MIAAFIRWSPTQKERAAGFRTTLHALLKIPYVIGADWFQYYDEPTHGRYDGENFNFGLVDIHDRPYEPLTTIASGLDLVGLKTAACTCASGRLARRAARSTKPAGTI